jgi:hypothetical protein
MLLSIQALLTGVIDYAGLFPPAALDMRSAVRNYAAYRDSEHSWMLGRFVAPVTRLDEFEKAAANHLGQSGQPWLLSALGGGDLKSDLEQITVFNQRNSGRAIIDTIEIKAERASDIEHAMEVMPAKLTPYFEIPIAHDPADLIKIIAALGARAKARTGGVTAESFPSSLSLASFIKVCADEDAPFKVTAGLHHPLRSVNRLTYEPDSDSALMHGFLNLFLAAAFAQNGMSVERLVELLEERSLGAFQFDSGSVTWRGEMIVRGQLRNARSLLAIAFGSCSFEEPVEDLKKLGLL